MEQTKHHKHELVNKHAYYDDDPEYKAYKVFIDESLVENKAAFAIFYKNNSKFNCYNRARDN